MKIISAQEHQAVEWPAHITLANDADPRTLDLSGVTRIDLQLPKFTDGRAYSQAVWALRANCAPRVMC
jgi:uncharacterized protein (DUF934 family)